MLTKCLVWKHPDKSFMAETQKLQSEVRTTSKALQEIEESALSIPVTTTTWTTAATLSRACTVWVCSSSTSDQNNHLGTGGSSRSACFLRRRACIAGLLSLPRLCLQKAWMLVFTTVLLSTERSKHIENTALTAGNTDPVDSKQASTDNNKPWYSHSYQPSIRHQSMFCFSF